MAALTIKEKSAIVLNELMINKNLTQIKFAKLMGFSKQRAYSLMREGIGSIKLIYDIAEVFGLSGSQFLRKMEKIL